MAEGEFRVMSHNREPGIRGRHDKKITGDPGQVDFDLLISRQGYYAHEEACSLDRYLAEAGKEASS